MYIYYVPTNGLNDILGRVIWFMKVCQMYNFILLVDGERGTYKVDFSKYFKFPQEYIITDGETIRDILDKHPITLAVPRTETVTPPVTYFGEIKGDHKMIWFKNLRHFPCSYPVFNQLIFNTDVKQECHRRRSLLGAKYVGIQVRNTDYTCNYPLLYETNKALIHSFPVYLATDCPEVLQFFKSKGVNVKNFITFQRDGKPLHKSTVPSSIKFMDMLCDIYLIGMAETVLSVSKGGFIKLMMMCNHHKDALTKQFGLP